GRQQARGIPTRIFRPDPAAAYSGRWSTLAHARLTSGQDDRRGTGHARPAPHAVRAARALQPGLLVSPARRAARGFGRSARAPRPASVRAAGGGLSRRLPARQLPPAPGQRATGGLARQSPAL